MKNIIGYNPIELMGEFKEVHKQLMNSYKYLCPGSVPLAGPTLPSVGSVSPHARCRHDQTQNTNS